MGAASSGEFDLAAAQPAQLAIITQPSAGVTSGVVLAVQPVVELRDASNAPVLQSGVVVTVAKASGTGTLGGTLTATTNAQGRAAFTGLAITGAGAHTLSFSATNIPAVVSSAIMVSIPIPTQLVFLTHPSGATSGLVFTAQPVIELRDASNQPVAQAGVVVTAAKTSGTGTLGGTLTATTNTQGRATFQNLQIAGVGTHAIVVTANGLGAASSVDFNVAAVQPTSLALTVQPVGAVTGATLTSAPEVELRSSTGQPVGTSGIPITATRSSGSAVLSGTTTVLTAANGRALFSNLMLSGAGANRLTFSAPGLAPVTSNDVTIATLPQCAISVIAGKGGTVSGASNGDCGRAASVQATNDAFYTFANWTENGVVVSTANPFAFSAATSRTLTANFTPVLCTLSLTAGNGGTVSVSSGGATEICGRQVTITATPNNNFTFTNWTENAAEISTVSPFTFALLANRTIIASFSATQCAVTLATVTDGAIAVTAGGATGACGRQVTLQASPNAGYTFGNWTQNGVAATTINPWTFTLSAPVTAGATFPAVPVNPQQIATRFATALLSGTGNFTLAERQWIDAQGNKNDLVDLGDLVALLQKNPGVSLNAGLLQSVLASPNASHFSRPVKEPIRK